MSQPPTESVDAVVKAARALLGKLDSFGPLNFGNIATEGHRKALRDALEQLDNHP